MCGTRFSKDAGPYGLVSSARMRIKPGETLKLNIGGEGRPVVGKLHVLEGIPVKPGGGRLVLRTNDKPEPPAPSAEEMDRYQPLLARTIAQVFHAAPLAKDVNRYQRFLYHFNSYRSPEGLARRLSNRVHGIQIHADGTFRGVEVLPGNYTLCFRVGDDYNNPIVTRKVVVKPNPELRNNQPLDVGTVEIKPPAAK